MTAPEPATWQGWTGRTSTVSAWLDPAQGDRMNATLDRDPAFAEGDAVPPAWHWLFFHDVVRAGDLGPEGHPRLGLTMPPVPLPRRMWAAGTLDLLSPLRFGERARRVSTVRSVEPKDGGSGPLVFVTVAHEVLVGDEPRVREEQVVVYRDLTPAGPRRAEVPSDDAALRAVHHLDSTALFRYSALTFNGHRIHYDADWCRDVEGYSGLVVHGPLLATLLLDLAVAHGRPARRFTYRAVSPVLLPSSVHTLGRAEGDATALWATGDDGATAMRGRLE